MKALFTPTYHHNLFWFYSFSGNMSGDSKQAFWNPQDFTLLMLQACSKTGLAPSLDWDMEMTPVDFAAQVIVKLTQNPNIALSKTLHIINDRPMKSRYTLKVFRSFSNKEEKF